MDEETRQIKKLQLLEQRDWELWWIAILVIIALTISLIGIQAPQLIGAPKDITVQLKIYLVGLSILILLFCAYVFQAIHSLRKLKIQLWSTKLENVQIQSLLETVKERTEKLQASESNFRTLLERNLDAVLVMNRNRIVKFANPASESMFGHKEEDLLGLPFDYRVAVGEMLEIDIQLPDEKTVVAEMRVIGTTWEGEDALLASLRDITMHKQVEENLKKANEDLKKLDQLKSNFVSMVSHELRTPLTSIKSAVGLLLSRKTGPINDNQDRFLKIAVRNIDRLNAIVSDLLDLSKVEAGKVKFNFSELEIRRLILGSVSAFRPEAEVHALALELNCPESLPTLYADQARVEQILTNLLSNAVKFTPAGGRITLSARRFEEMVEVSVADTGIGIPVKDKERIFDRFYQVDNLLHRKSRGTGLGLAITKEFVEAHGGKISLESRDGKGCRFFFTLPVYSPKACEMEELREEIYEYRDNPSISLLLLVLNSKNHSLPYSPLGQLEKFVRKLMPRASDKIISQPAHLRLVLFLTGTPKRGAMVVRRKLEQAWSENPMENEDIPVPVPMIIGPATYPEDGTTISALINSIQPVGR